MKILVTGHYKQGYNRIQIILKGLEKHGVEIIEHRYEKRDRKTVSKIITLSQDCDLVFLPSFTHLDVPFVKKAVKIPVVFDPLVSRYMTKVFDRKTIWKYSPRALKNYMKDKRAFNYSDLILADTFSHKEYYCSHFRVDPEKIIVVPIGVNTGDFFPKNDRIENRDFTVVGFYGTFIPLHGIEKIILTANELRERKDIRFAIYGIGPLFNKISSMVNKMGINNIDFKGWVDFNELNNVINSMDICLGIFGESIKTELVIPNKIYHYAASGKPIITRDTKGINEIFTADQDIVLCSNHPSDIAKEVLRLVNNPDLRMKIGHNAYTLIHDEYNEMKITLKLLEAFEKLIKT